MDPPVEFESDGSLKVQQGLDVTGVGNCAAVGPDSNPPGRSTSIGAAASVPLAIADSLARLADLFISPGAVARGVKEVLHCATVLSIAAFRGQLAGIRGGKFYPISRKIDGNIGHRDEYAEAAVSGLARLRGLSNSKLVEREVSNPAHTVQTRSRGAAQEGVLRPHRLNATVLARTGTGARVLAEARKPGQGAVSVLTVKREWGTSSSEVSTPRGKFPHKPKKARWQSITRAGGEGSSLPTTCEEKAFEVAELFSEAPDTFKFPNSSEYERRAVIAFIARALRNRRRTDKTLKRVTDFVTGFYDFTQGPDPPLPFYGEECLLAATDWLVSLKPRGALSPQWGSMSYGYLGKR